MQMKKPPKGGFIISVLGVEDAPTAAPRHPFVA
jgi:hypothetical protein